MRGGNGDDLLQGGADDDRLIGGAGRDRLEGGGGIDTAVYSGDMDDYTVAFNGNGVLTVRDNRVDSPEDLDFLTSIEFIQFSDGIIDTAGL